MLCSSGDSSLRGPQLKMVKVRVVCCHCHLQLSLLKTFIAGLGDSANEESDSDLSDVPEVDSDVEQEQQIKYDRPVYKEDLAMLKAKLNHADKDGKSRVASKQADKRQKAPAGSLQLEFVHG